MIKYITLLFLTILLLSTKWSNAQRVYNDTKAKKNFQAITLKKENLFRSGHKKVDIKLNGQTKKLLLVDTLNGNRGKHYRGTIENDSKSLADITVYDNEVIGLVVSNGKNYSVYERNGQIVTSQDLASPLKCFTIDTNITPTTSQTTSCKTVKAYWICDYALFQSCTSSVTITENYATALFNQMATLYANDGINVVLEDVFVYTSPDPYVGLTSTGAVLSKLQENLGANFHPTANICHFLTSRKLGGGIAWVDVLCFKQYAFAVSANLTATYNNVPQYSWNVEELTHETGHNLGSPHTQSCNWVGGAIDGCYESEGDCPNGPIPTNGGTIMSYCHLRSDVGINFANGFGQQPGDLIRGRVNGAACVACVPTCAAPTNPISFNIGTTYAQLKWDSTDTNYTVQYRKSTVSTWTTVSSSGNSVLISGLTGNTLYKWKVKSGCSDYTSEQSFTTLGTATCAAATGLSGVRNSRTTATLSWSPVSGATSYTVNVYKSSDNSLYKTVSGNSPQVISVQRNKTYYFKVVTKCGATSSTSNNSNTF